MVIPTSFAPPCALCFGPLEFGCGALNRLPQPFRLNLQAGSSRISFRPRRLLPPLQPHSPVNLLASSASTFIYDSHHLSDAHSSFLPIFIQSSLPISFSESVASHRSVVTAVTRVLRAAAVAGVLPLLPTRRQAYRERRSTR